MPVSHPNRERTSAQGWDICAGTGSAHGPADRRSAGATTPPESQNTAHIPSVCSDPLAIGMGRLHSDGISGVQVSTRADHRHPTSAGRGLRQQTDLHMTTSPPQAQHRIRAYLGPAHRVDGDVGALPGQPVELRGHIPALRRDHVLRTHPLRGVQGLRAAVTAITRAPQATAIITRPSPGPPTPKAPRRRGLGGDTLRHSRQIGVRSMDRQILGEEPQCVKPGCC